MPELDRFHHVRFYSSTASHIRYHATQRPNSTAVIDQGKVFTYEDFTRDIAKMKVAMGDLRLAAGQLVGVEFLQFDGNFSGFYFHWVQLLALEELGVATMSFTRAEAPHMQDILQSLDLVLAFPDAPGVASKKQHIMDKDWISHAIRRAPDFNVPPAQLYPDTASRIVKSSGTTGSIKYMIRSVENQEYIYRTAQLCGGYEFQSRFFAAGGFPVSAFHAAAVTCIRAGGCCVYDTKKDTAEALSSYDITHASFLVHSLMSMLGSISKNYKKPTSLRILTIGSAVSQAVRIRLLKFLAEEVFETYGTNESSSISTIDALGVGVVLPGVEVDVVDENDVAVIGVPGRIRVRSQGCVRGYYNNPAATKKMFRDGWFYPGDIGIKPDAHTLSLVGRSDSLLNIRGLKVAPEEFEEILMRDMPLKDVCVLTLPDKENIEHVVIVVTLNEGADRSDITNRIQKLLPPFFGATRVAYVPEIPKTGTGKIERAFLRQALLEHGQNT